MSKNLEKEYREFTNQDAPDLWERIKSGLEEKEPASEAGGSEPREAHTLITGGMNEKKSAEARRLRQRKYRIWGVAAACLCLAVTGFSMRNLLLPGQDLTMDGSAGMMMQDNSLNGEAEMAKAPSMENDYGAIEVNEGMAADRMDMASVGSVLNNVEEPKEIFEPQEEQEEYRRQEGASDGGEYSEIDVLKIKITSVINMGDQNAYMAEVISSEAMSLQAGDRITLYDGRSGGEILEEGEIYEIYATAVTDSGGEKIYRMTDIK